MNSEFAGPLLKLIAFKKILHTYPNLSEIFRISMNTSKPPVA
jgi:hypothetical protein